MKWKRAVTMVAAIITFAGSANLMTAQEDPGLCVPQAPISILFVGQCPWDIGGLCHVLGFSGAGTYGFCEEAPGGVLVTCGCTTF